MSWYSSARAFLSREWLLVAYLLMFLVLLVWYAPPLPTLASYVDIRVLVSIFGFLLVVQGLRDSGFLSWLATRLALHAGDARSFSLIVVISTVALAAFVTNDLALFTFVPLVLAAPLQETHKFRLLVLLALAANVGAFISPVGNPQKLILWQLSSMDIFSFTVPFVLPFIVLAAGLIAYVLVLIPRAPISVVANGVHLHRHAALFVSYLVLLALGWWVVAVGLVVLYFLASKQYVAIAMGTTVGAMGLIVASVANIIAVRLSSERRKYLKFHIYSLPFFLFAVLAVLFFL